MTVDIAALRRLSDGFSGTFEFRPEHVVDHGIGNIGDFVDVDDALVYIPADDADPYTIASPLERHIAEPIAELLNAVPALLDDSLVDERNTHEISAHLARPCHWLPRHRDAVARPATSPRDHRSRDHRTAGQRDRARDELRLHRG